MTHALNVALHVSAHLLLGCLLGVGIAELTRAIARRYKSGEMR